MGVTPALPTRPLSTTLWRGNSLKLKKGKINIPSNEKGTRHLQDSSSFQNSLQTKKILSQETKKKRKITKKKHPLKGLSLSLSLSTKEKGELFLVFLLTPPSPLHLLHTTNRPPRTSPSSIFHAH